MRRIHVDESGGDVSGQDSFLDIVANIVGILILLVVVVGVRASQHIDKTAALNTTIDEPVGKTSSLIEKVQPAMKLVSGARHDLKDLIRQMVNVRREALVRDEERLQLNTYVAAVEKELEEERSELSREQQQDFDLRRELKDAQKTLDGLTRQQVALLAEAPEVEELENIPTPLAQTVSGGEIHLRLAAGRVAFIPLDDLLMELRHQAEEKLWELRDRNSAVSTVGPLSGFRLRYRLEKKPYGGGGMSGAGQRGSVVQLSRWELVPEVFEIGEPLEQAMQPNSDLMHCLKGRHPGSTTITVWTYPDSFREFRELRQGLYSLGCGIAGRPLPEGIRIGGSPHGTRSVAQ